MAQRVAPALAALRARARQATLGAPLPLGAALDRLGFVQADPLRAPARAQDLILRHRVRDYRAGDLERRFAALGLEEDFLYAYGFMPPATRQLLHPRPDRDAPDGLHRPEGLAAAVLAFVQARGRCHPRELEAEFGAARAVNGWGGYSKATTRALESLHHYGLLRVVQRRDGIRVYAPALPAGLGLPAPERARQLVLRVAGLLAPVPASSLNGALALMARRNPGLGALAPVVAALLRDGALEQAVVEGERYLWPAGSGGDQGLAVPRDLRLLAPFDPIVWDRRRFAHLWGWDYRFEAYTPAPRRRFGHYALPMLWGDAVIGWANVALQDGGLQVGLGYAGAAPSGRGFQRALEAELDRMRRFLTPRPATGSASQQA